MAAVQRSLIAEIENAIASGSSERRVETLRRVTDLFMVNASRFADEQVDVFDDVICKLAEKIETKARIELANRLAPVDNAPTEIMRALARDEVADVALPVLTHSNKLTDEDLLDCADGGCQDRLLAISKRATISEVVSDVLVTRGNCDVVRSVARNDGARIGGVTFGKLVEKAASDDELAVSVGMRKDIPQEHFHALVAKASEVAFRKLSQRNPVAADEIGDVVFNLTGYKVGGQPKTSRDYKGAMELFKLILDAGMPIDPTVRGFAKSDKLEETVASLAVLCKLPPEAVEHILTDEGVDVELSLILSKAAGLSWHTAKQIMMLTRPGAVHSAEVSNAVYLQFERLQASTAQRVVRFYQVRCTVGGAPH